jgi:hypothetical protein
LVPSRLLLISCAAGTTNCAPPCTRPIPARPTPRPPAILKQDAGPDALRAAVPPKSSLPVFDPAERSSSYGAVTLFGARIPRASLAPSLQLGRSRLPPGLFAFRSPLLRESSLISSPPSTDMLKFAGFSDGRNHLFGPARLPASARPCGSCSVLPRPGSLEIPRGPCIFCFISFFRCARPAALGRVEISQARLRGPPRASDCRCALWLVGSPRRCPRPRE